MANVKELTIVSTGAASTVTVNGGASLWADGIIVQADANNTGHVRLGPSGSISATVGIDLAPGDLLPPAHTERANINLGSMGVYFANASDKLHILYFEE